MSSSILSNSIVASVGRLAGGLIGLGVTALLARYLGPSLFGSYILLLSFGVVIQLMADAGLYLTLSRDIAKSGSSAVSELLSHTMTLRILLLVAAFFGGWCVSLFVPSLAPYSTVFVIIALGLAFQSLSQVLMSVFQWRGEIWRASIGDLVGRVVQLAGLFFLGVNQTGLAVFAVIFTASTATAFIVHQWLLPRESNWKPVVNLQQWRSLWLRSWPIGAMLLLNAIYFRIDAVILSLLRSSEEVGWYGVAYRLIEAGLFFPAMFGGLLLPRLAESLVDKKQIATRYITESIQLVILGAGALVAIVSTLSPKMVVFIAGQEYLPAAPLLSILGWALAAMFIGNIFGFALIAMNRQTTLLKLYAILVFFNVTANLVFIPLYGAAAAAATTLVTEVISAFVAAVIVRRLLLFRISAWYSVRVLASSAATAALAFVLPSEWHVVVLVTVCFTAYVGISYILGTLRLSHMRQLAERPVAV